MTAEARTTTDHDTIRNWVEQRGGHPAAVAAVHEEDDAGILRIDFEDGEEDEGLEAISWDEFFEKFDDKNLAFLYQEETKSGKTSRFFKFVRRGDSSDEC